jgi:serine phosphatase RsbU (regulator of sigma subunit)
MLHRIIIKIIFLIAVVVCAKTTFANRQIDSLYTLLKKTDNDTVKVSLQIKIANLLLQQDSAGGIRQVKKVLYAINDLADKKFAFRALDKMGRVLYTNGFLSQARSAWANALQNAKDLNDKEWQAKLYNRIAWYLQREDNLKRCILYYDSALSVAKNSSEQLLSEVHRLKGRAHYDIGDYKNAMDHYIAAQRLFEKNKWRNEEYGHLLHFIGSVFKQQNLYEKALDYYQQELQLARDIKNDALEAEALYLCAGMFGTMGDLEEELNYLQKAIEIYKRDDNKRMLALLYGNLSSNYGDKGDYKNAIASCEQALALYEETGATETLASVYRSLGDYSSKLGDHQKALAYLKRAMDLAEKIETKRLLNKADITEAMAFAYSRSGNYKKAFDLLLQYRYLNDSLTNQSNTEYLHDLEAQYETEKKEKEIALLNADKKAKDEELLRKQSQGRTLIIITVLGLIIAIISGIAFFNKRKTNQLLSRQVNEINYQNAVIKEKNKDITDSIQYAKRLQEAVFPEANTLNNHFAESFVLFRPKDIVSGDFYWFEEVKGKTILAVGDCTGHGVPGAFMSILGHNLLNQIIIEQGLSDPAEILRLLDKQVSHALNKKGRKDYNDGMDIALCVIDKTQKQMSFAGANRPLVVKTKDGLKELKPNKFPIGGNEEDRCKVFHKQELPLNDSDVLYLFSDGYYDQFGGPNGKKFKYKRLIEQISGIASKPLKEQEIILSSTLENWRGNLEQLDDICVVGVRI